ncbi:hypothetical protein AOQ84DRAFT_281945, partial [Glonium stellatum]
STWMATSRIARWQGRPESPVIFFPFPAFWGSLVLLITKLYGYAAHNVLVTVAHALRGSPWMSTGLLHLPQATGALLPRGIHEHFPELSSWFVALAFFIWYTAGCPTHF